MQLRHDQPVLHCGTVPYDHMGRAITVTDAVGDVEYAYPPTARLRPRLGELVSVTDSLGQVTTNTYDTAFRLTKVTDDIGKETHYSYDAYGRQSAVGAGTSGTVDVTAYSYPPTADLRRAGLLDSVEYGSSTYTASYTYDGEGRLVQLTDWIDGVDGLRYEYDDVGRLVEITDYDDSTLTYTYDGAGNVLTMTDYPPAADLRHGNTTTYTYPPTADLRHDIGQLATLTAPGSKVWSYTYPPAADLRHMGRRCAVAHNRLSRVDIPNGMHTEYAYDTSGRQDAILRKDGTTVVQGFGPRGLSCVCTRAGKYSATANIAPVQATFAMLGLSPAVNYVGRSRTPGWPCSGTQSIRPEGAFSTARSRTFRTVPFERLVEAVRGNHATPTIEATYAYTYDDGDNPPAADLWLLTRVTFAINREFSQCVAACALDPCHDADKYCLPDSYLSLDDIYSTPGGFILL